MIKPARSNRKTLTEAAQDEIRQAIVKGIYSPGSQLPTEAELGALLGVSRTVVREALRLLEEDGLIARRHGVGTFVRKHPILKNLNFNFGITEMIKSANMVAGTSYLSVKDEPADHEVVNQLELAAEALVTLIERVRTADGRPVVYSVDILPKSLLNNAEFDSERLLTESVYQVLQARLGYVIEYGVARLLPAHASPYVAEKLGLTNGALVLHIVQTDYSMDDEPLLFSREYHLPDAFDFMIWRRGPADLRYLSTPE
jgi:GntR family transcriptional regulator